MLRLGASAVRRTVGTSLRQRSLSTLAASTSSSSARLFFVGGAAAVAAAAAALYVQNKAEAQGTSPLSLDERVSALELEKAVGLNQAFVFIKPHAVNEKVAEVLRLRLSQHGITITDQGLLSGEDIDKNSYIDRHYGAIASKAVSIVPKDLNVPDKGQDDFKKAFGLSWKDAVKQGKVLNASQACKTLGINGNDLDGLWSKLKRGKDLIKFGGGFYCGQIGDKFVINGFYMSMRGKYTEPSSKLHYFLVEWDPRMLSWEEFRGKVLGATDPATAVKGSVRREIYDDWKKLGLSAQPDVGDNGVHASASPFEALAERVNWTGADVTRDNFGRGLLAAGIPPATVTSWFQDPQVPFEGKKQSLFDLLEDIDSGDCIAKAQLIAGIQ